MTMLLLALVALPLRAAVTPGDISTFAADNHELSKASTPRQGLVYRSIKRTRSVAATATEIATAWKIPEPVATQLVEGLVLAKVSQWKMQPGNRGTRWRELFRQAVKAAPRSREVWRFLLEYYDGTAGEGCDDPQIRDTFLAQPFALALYGYDPPCYEWLPTIARLHPDDFNLRYELVDYLSSEDSAVALAASRWLVDDLDRRGAPVDALTLHALRTYWAQLGDAGLGEELLGDAARREALLERLLAKPPTAVKAPIGETVSQERAKYFYDLARRRYLLALVEAGRLGEARTRAAQFGINAALVNELLSESVEGDLFDRWFGDVEKGVYWSEASDGAVARRVAAKFLAAHEYPTAAEKLGSHACAAPLDADREKWIEEKVAGLPPVFTQLRGHYAQAIAAADGRAGCRAVVRASRPEMSSRLTRYLETPLTKAERARPALSAYQGDIPLPQSFSLVRAEKLGADVLAVCISPAVDPAGEVSRGGYWLLRSPDDGRTWSEPRYLGFQDLGPYVVLERGRLPMHWGEVLRLEVEVHELDPRSITFPPVGLASRRDARDLYIDIPLATLEKDTDADGWPDILEAKLHTDPARADTDGDGITDRLDDFPQVSARATPHKFALIVTDLLTRLVGFESAGLIEPLRDSASEATAPDLLAAAGNRAAPGSVLFTFIEGDPAMFAGLRAGGQVIVLDEAGVAELQARSGPIYPLQFPMIIADPAGRRAVVQWSAGWVGGTLLYDLVDGKWQAKELSRWITRGATTAPNTSPG
jgi:hypothetical protein